MKTEQSELLEMQRQRRKRINKLKSIITRVVSIWMLFSLIAIIVLSIQVIRLSTKTKTLESINIKNEKLLKQIMDDVAKQNDSIIESNITESEIDTELDTESNTEMNTEISDTLNDENLATEDDIHKVYLTFDSEPSENTYLILDKLKQNGIKATFFVSGDDSEECKAICKRIVEDGHTIGMHSYSNRYSTVYASKDSFEEDLINIYDYIFDATGIESIYYRFPGGSNNEISNIPMSEYINMLKDKGFIYYDWNVSAGDSSAEYSVDEIVNNVTEGVMKYKTSVVLLHDYSNKSTTAEALSPLVKALKGMDAEILPIDENTYVVQY